MTLMSCLFSPEKRKSLKLLCFIFGTRNALYQGMNGATQPKENKMSGYYSEKLKEDGRYLSNLELRNLFESASALFARLDETHKPIAAFYQQYPHKAIDKTSWEHEEVRINNLWKEARLAMYRSKREWKKSRFYIGPDEGY